MRAAILLHTLRAVRSQWWPAAHIAQWQERALIQSLRFVCAHVPFYRALGIAPASIVSAADLARFPVIRKADLQTDTQRFWADGMDVQRLHSSRTSGSTGEPTVTYFDADTWALCKYALKIRRILAVARPLGRRCLIVSEQPPARTAEYGRERPFGAGWFYAERLVSLFEDMAVHRRVIAEFAPDMLYAFPSYFLELARNYREAGLTPPPIRWLFTSSEVLTPMVRARIESEFGGRVYDIYGCTEFKEVTWECQQGGHHVNVESTWVESIDHSIVLTTLRNRAMPLIRFQTGDRGSLSATPCLCGRQSPQLFIEMGREGDVLTLPDGRRLSPYLLTTVIEELPGLHQYRILQNSPAHLTVELAASDVLSAPALDRCRQQLSEVLGAGVDVEFARVPRFERSPGGKHRVFVRQAS